MKNTICLLLCLILLCSFLLPASASQLLPGFTGSSSEVFVDEASGTALCVPSGWEIHTVENDAIARAEFVSSQDEAAVIQYGSVDMWSTQTPSLQENTPRKEFDNGRYSAADIAQLIGTKEKYVKSLELEGRDYFRAELGKRRLFSFKVTDTYLIHVTDGWMYVYAFHGSSRHDLYSAFESLVISAVYPEASEEAAAEATEPSEIPQATEAAESIPSEADIYREAVDAYEHQFLFLAQELFESVPNYEDSQKYLRLIRIRNAGGNVGVGSAVYDPLWGLTDQNKQDIDAAARDFYFADTSEVLLCNSDVACYYLVGEWKGGSKCYIHFKMNSYGGTYNIGSKLSTNYQSTFSIEDGILRVDVIGSNKKTLALTLLSPDCMQVITYEKNNNCYTLNRK